MASIFISHSTKDKAFARRLAEDLQRLGHTPWLDEWQIKVGECIVTKIGSGIEDSDYVVIVLSSHSVKSGWVDKEWKTKYWSEIQTGKTLVLPVLVEDCSIPNLLATKKYADFRGNYAVALVDLANAIGDSHGEPLKGNPPPTRTEKEKAHESDLGTSSIAQNSMPRCKESLITEIHPPAFKQFLDKCQSAKTGIFINIQVDLKEWFDPWAQVHLALQDSACRCIQLAALHATPPKTDDTFWMPFRRVLFVPEDWPVLRKNITNTSKPESNLVPLMDIHSCMASPLAIVAADRFLESILQQEPDFFRNVDNDKTIGLRADVMQQLSSNKTRAKELLRAELEAMAMERGRIVPTIDCAVLYFDASSNQGQVAQNSLPQVWQAAPDTDGTLYYYQITDEGFIGLEDAVGIDVSSLEQNAGKIYRRLLTFADIINRTVFELVQIADDRFDGREILRNPVIGFLKSSEDYPGAKITYPRKKFDPFQLRREREAV